MIQRKADNLKDIANGKDPESPLSQKDWDDVLKTIKEMPNLERFEGVEIITPDKGDEKEPILEVEKEQVKGNAFEETSKRIKEKQINGSTKIGTKTN